MKKLILSAVFCGLSLSINAQGIYSSQQSFVPLSYNPAYAATSDAMRLLVHYRHQQSDAAGLQLQTLQLQAIKPFLKNNRRFGGLGISFLNDRAEDFNTAQFTHIGLGYAHNFRLGEKLQLALGLQASYGQQQSGLQNLSTGSQWIPNVGYVPTAANGETDSPFNTSYFSLGSGLMLYCQQEQQTQWFVSLAGYQLNQPEEATGGYTLPMQWRAQAGVLAYSSTRFSVLPMLSVQVEAHRRLWSIGNVVKYHFVNENPFGPIGSGSLNLLTQATLDNTLVMGLQLEQPRYSLGVSYDWAFRSRQSNRPAMGAAEFAISFHKSLRKAEKAPKPAEISEVRNFFEEQGKPAQQQEDLAEAKAATLPAYQGEGVSFELRRDFNFAFNETELNEEARVWLDELHELLVNNPHLKLEITGHTDDVGTRQANQEVSEKRAMGVYEYLLTKGIKADRMDYSGKGATEPLVPNKSEAERAKNRRVDFRLYTEAR